MKIKFILNAHDLEGNPIVCTEIVENSLGVVPKRDEVITLDRGLCLRVDGVFYEVARGEILDVTIRLIDFVTDNPEKLEYFLNTIKRNGWSITKLN